MGDPIDLTPLILPLILMQVPRMALAEELIICRQGMQDWL